MKNMVTRHYSNMAELDLNEPNSINKAKTQILHQEPVILNLPKDFNMNLNWQEYNCLWDKVADTHYNCDAGKALKELAKNNQIMELNELSSACIESSSQLDIDCRNHRLIFHD